MRSRWLARRLWMIAVADVLWTTRRHWKRLDDRRADAAARARAEVEGAAVQNLSARERREAEELLEKLGHIELAGSVADIVLPFRPLSRLATKSWSARAGQKRLDEPTRRTEPASHRSAEHGSAPPPRSAPRAGSTASPAGRPRPGRTSTTGCRRS